VSNDPTSPRVDPLTELLDGLPVGISAAVAGVPFYQNKMGRAHSDLPSEGDVVLGGKKIRVEQLSLALLGAACEVRLSRDVTDQRDLEDDLFKRAYFDDLTGLPNRGLIEKSCAGLIERSGPEQVFALAFVDLDGFKNINDYYGHGAGDALLLKMAQRLATELGPTDMLARVGGDEFVLLLSPIASMDQLAADIGRFLDRLKEPFFIDGHEIFSSASIGVSLFPADGRTYDELCSNADRAMYRIKGGAKGSVQFFNPTLDQAATERVKTEQRLRLAIRDRRLTCAYQPKVDFRRNEVVGVEVLLRWRDEEGLIQPPGDFVNLAVELGLMDEITHLVLGETLGAMDRINDAFGPGSTISLNIAAKQADEPIFMRSVVDALEATGYAERFMLELTEEAFLAKSRFQTLVLPMVREIGAKVSIDDFGVGYSSLAALADITADELKVDRSFISDIHKRPRSQSILKAIESLAQALGMSIIVEGVETADELVYLQAATRIRLAQGYYFAKPMFLDEISLRHTHSHELRLDAETPRVPQARLSAGRT
jgi:diguanylate cyclase (GGDEF)-like protein